MKYSNQIFNNTVIVILSYVSNRHNVTGRYEMLKSDI